MSQENVKLVRDFLNTFIEVDEGLTDPERLTKFATPDATLDLGAFSAVVERGEIRPPIETAVLGLEDFLRFRAAWMEPYDDFSYEPVKIIDAGGNRVAVTLHQRGKPHGSDSWVEMDYGIVYTVEEGLISRAEFYATPDEALQAAGLRE
jgi:ketosteroid isomerase-like protein